MLSLSFWTLGKISTIPLATGVLLGDSEATIAGPAGCVWAAGLPCIGGTGCVTTAGILGAEFVVIAPAGWAGLAILGLAILGPAPGVGLLGTIVRAVKLGSGDEPAPGMVGFCGPFPGPGPPLMGGELPAICIGASTFPAPGAGMLAGGATGLITGTGAAAG